MQQRAVSTHRQARNVALLRFVGNGEVVFHKLRQLLVEEVIEILPQRSVLVGLVVAGEGHHGHAVFLRIALCAGVAQPCLIVIAMPMQQIQHREFSRQRVGVGQMQVAGRERRQRHLNIYRVAQRVGEKITMHLCHNIPS